MQTQLINLDCHVDVCYQRRDLLSQELKTATNDDMKIEIQRQLEGAERAIRTWKGQVNEGERKVNEYNDKLGPLKKEGEFVLSSCMHHPCHVWN